MTPPTEIGTVDPRERELELAQVLLDLARAGLTITRRRRIYRPATDGSGGVLVDDRQELSMQPLELALEPRNAELVARTRALKPELLEWFYSAEYARRAEAIFAARAPGSSWILASPHGATATTPRCCSCNSPSRWIAPDGRSRHPWCAAPAAPADAVDLLAGVL